MFFKTRKQATDLFTIPTDERRHAFRVAPSDAAPVVLRFRGRTHRVRDISAGGAAFENAEFATGDSGNAVIFLPGQADPLTVRLEIVSVESTGICHCRFVGLAAAKEDELHFYVLNRQKEQIRADAGMANTRTDLKNNLSGASDVKRK